MKRKTRLLLERSRDSLVLSIELFNRPSDRGRVEGVLLCLDHAFEMLFKAVVLEKTGRIRNPRETFNYGLDKCLNICQSQLSMIDEDQALILRNLDGFRDAATHDIVEISEGLLYGHAQSAVTIFGTILKKAFNQDLVDALPRRILPISTAIPTDISAIVAEDMAAARAMLGGRRRREDEAEARIRPYQIIEKNIREARGVPRGPTSLPQIVRRLKAGDWKTVLPMVAGLVQPDSTGIPISLHVTKRNGFPVRIDPSASTAIAFRYVKPEDKYPYLTAELSDKLGIGRHRLLGLVKAFQLKGNDEFHTGIRVSKTGQVQRYSEKALQVLRRAIQEEGLDSLWNQAREGKRLNPMKYAAASAIPAPAA